MKFNIWDLLLGAEYSAFEIVAIFSSFAFLGISLLVSLANYLRYRRLIKRFLLEHEVEIHKRNSKYIKCVYESYNALLKALGSPRAGKCLCDILIRKEILLYHLKRVWLVQKGIIFVCIILSIISCFFTTFPFLINLFRSYIVLNYQYNFELSLVLIRYPIILTMIILFIVIVLAINNDRLILRYQNYLDNKIAELS